MEKEYWQQLKKIFSQVSELPISERDAALSRLCEGDSTLNKDVSALLDADKTPLEVLNTPAVELGQEDSAGMEGQVIDGFTLREKLAQGGMGAVYLADQDDGGFHRQVAVKIFSHSGTQENIHRFNQEKQILASLDHPNIARLLDGGVLADGRPYYVMEYIDGLPIHQYCTTHNLVIAERIKLLIQVCKAVHYAHQRMLIHRDIKSANILVDTEGKVHLLDFGIAKLNTPTADDFTRDGLLPLTIDYASPEQILGHQVTAASDIYSLGALFYLLLCDQKPHDLSDLDLQAVVAVVLDRQPKPPSECLEHVAWPDADDVNAICLMALRKEPERRYESAQAMADDLQRYLLGRAVEAHPDSWHYQLRKLIKRRPLAVSVVTGVLLLTLGFSLYTYTQAKALAQQKATAEAEAARAQSVSAFLTDMLASVRPELAQGEKITVIEVVDEAAKKLQQPEADLSPVSLGSIHQTLAITYTSLGHVEAALLHAKKATAVLETALGEQHPMVMQAKHNLARAYLLNSDYSQAVEVLQPLLDQRVQLLGKQHQDTNNSRHNLALAYAYAGRINDALRIDQELYELNLERLGAEHEATLDSLVNLIADYHAIGDYEKAVQMGTELLLIQQRVLGEKHPTTLKSSSNLSIYLRLTGKVDAAEKLAIETIALRKAVLGDEHPDTLNSMNNLAELYIESERMTEAAAIVEQVLAQRRATLGDQHEDTQLSMLSLARLHFKQEEYLQSEQLSRQVLLLSKQGNHTDGITYHKGSSILIEALLKLEQYDEATLLAKFALQHRQELFGASNPQTQEMLKLVNRLKALRGEKLEAK